MLSKKNGRVRLIQREYGPRNYSCNGSGDHLNTEIIEDMLGTWLWCLRREKLLKRFSGEILTLRTL